MSSIVHFHTREKKNRVVGVCVCLCVKITFDSTPKTEIDLLRCFFFCLRYNGFKFITVNPFRKLRQNFWYFLLISFWNTLTRFMYVFMFIFESFLTVSITFRICPGVFVKREKEIEKNLSFFIVVVRKKNKMFVTVFCLV